MRSGGNKGNYRIRAHLRSRRIEPNDDEIKDAKDEFESRLPDNKASKSGGVRLKPDVFFNNAVLADFNRLMLLRLHCDKRVGNLLIPQSLSGRANQGHGAFNGKRYPNVTAEDILTSVGWSWKKYWAQRQLWIDDIKVWVRRALRDPSDPRVLRMYSTDGDRPIAGYCFKEMLSGPKEVLNGLAGLLFTTSMDTFDPWRVKVQQKYDIHMGGGDCVAVSMPELKAEGLTLEDLSRNEYGKRKLKQLMEKGVILDVPSIGVSDIVKNGYVRRKKGKGVSDDAAIITAGLVYGTAGFYMAMAGDFIDTMDKVTAEVVRGGQDGALGDEIRHSMRTRGLDIPIDDEKIVDLIYLSAIDPKRPVHWVHCSQRYFYQDLEGTCAAMMHHNLVQNMKCLDNWKQAKTIANVAPYARIGFDKIVNWDFYKVYMDRLEQAEKEGIISYGEFLSSP